MPPPQASLMINKQVASQDAEDDASSSDSDDDPDLQGFSKVPVVRDPPRSSAALVDWKAFTKYKKKRFCSSNYWMMCEVDNRIWNGTLDDHDLLFLQKLGFLKT